MAEKKCLVTQDLVSKVQWFLDSPSFIIKPEKGGDGKLTWKDKSLLDLKNTLARVKGDFPIAAQQGIAFEKKVYEKANLEQTEGSEEFKEVCLSVKGFQYYQKGKKNLVVEGNDCFLYTKYDAILYPSTTMQEDGLEEEVGFIKDLKTTSSYSKGKYLKGFQHKLYCYVASIPTFEYIIAEWAEYPKIKKIHREFYHCQDMVQLEKDITFEIKECFNTIKDLGLWDTYRNSYCLY